MRVFGDAHELAPINHLLQLGCVGDTRGYGSFGGPDTYQTKMLQEIILIRSDAVRSFSIITF